MPRTERPLPVIIGGDYQHVMAHADIDHDRPGHVSITIEAVGQDADILASFLQADEVVALSFTGIPVQPRKNHNKEK